MALHHFIVNLNAGKGRSRSKQTSLIRAVSSAIPEHRIVEMNSLNDLDAYFAQLDSKSERIVAVGGDGTLHHVAGKITGTEHLLGIVPIGTGNDFATLLGLKSEQSIIEGLKSDKPVAIDTGKVTWEGKGEEAQTHTYINCIGIGFDAAVAARTHSSSVGAGILPYIINVLRELAAFKHQVCKIEYDGTKLRKNVFLLTVANGRSTGGGFVLTPNARIDDGLLDVCVASDVRKRRALRIMLQTFSGKHLDNREVDYFQTDHITIECEHGLPLHAEGEILSQRATSVELQVQPASLNLLADSSILPR